MAGIVEQVKPLKHFLLIIASFVKEGKKVLQINCGPMLIIFAGAYLFFMLASELFTREEKQARVDSC